MGHMLRKTAVIAVLILMMSSFTLGSTGRIQTVAATGNEGNVPAQSAQERGTAFLPTLADIITMGHAKAMADSSAPALSERSGHGRLCPARRGLRQRHPPVPDTGH